MQISVTEAKGRLSELVRHAEAGEEVVLTRYGRATVRMAPVRRHLDAESRRAVIAAVQASARRGLPGPDAARSQDFLYDDDGLPA